MQTKLIIAIDYNDNGTVATIHFDDSSTETRHAPDDGFDFSNLWFRDCVTGEVTQWGEDGAYQTDRGFAAL